jgi:heme/copper-type cytochrome/quinol oxidase subunit 2
VASYENGWSHHKAIIIIIIVIIIIITTTTTTTRVYPKVSGLAPGARTVNGTALRH